MKALKGPFKGKTHPPRYGFHKYWARKPANVISRHILHYTKPGQVVLDPFCGSGVSVIESLIAGRRAIGIDVNPLAIHLVRTTVLGAQVEGLEDALAKLESSVGRKINKAMSVNCPLCKKKAEIKYRVWSSVATCPQCANEQVLAKPGERAPRTIRCKKCNHSLPATTVKQDELNSFTVDCKNCRPKCKLFKAKGKTKLGPDKSAGFITNKRILAHAGLRIGHLYIEENWRHLKSLERAINKLSEAHLQVFLLALTATAAQASRLIPFRKNLSTGGPAWTVPGFWIPRVHLQMNVWRSFKSRCKRLFRGLKDAKAVGLAPKELVNIDNLSAGDGSIFLGDAKNTDLPAESVDYIITDPPYGDSVPYLEFSQLWFPLLNKLPDFGKEIVISDSAKREKGLAAFTEGLRQAFSEMYRVLKKGRYLTCFFQNRSLDVWQALGQAAQEAGFHLEHVELVEPAVVSAKSQLARSGSLTGDVVLQFIKPKTKRAKKSSNKDWKKVARKAAEDYKKSIVKEPTFEELASAVLVSLWQNDVVCGQGDLEDLLRSFL